MTGAQRGGVLLMLLALVGVAALIFLSGTLPGLTRAIAQQQRGFEALAQAKEALIGYAATYRNGGHPDDVFGYLPNPDMGLLFGNQEGMEAGNQGAADVSLLGKLPWRSLKLPVLRDADGECLWYAVSGRFKTSPKTGAANGALNWDTPGQLDIAGPDGALSDLTDVAAIVFAPGPVLGSQNRSAGASAICGGSYDAAAYLDPADPATAIAGVVNYFPGSANNARASGTANKMFLSAGSAAYNDRLLTIRVDEIFRVIKQRSDFKADIDALLADTAACLNGLPGLPAPSPADKGISAFAAVCRPADPLAGDAAPVKEAKAKKQKVYDNWKDNLLYALLPAPAPVRIDGAWTSPCRGVLFFGGEKTSDQIRRTSADKANPDNYLEDGEAPNRRSFRTGGTAYSGASAFDRNAASRDLVACLGANP